MNILRLKSIKYTLIIHFLLSVAYPKMNKRYYYSCSVFGCSNTTKNCAYTFFHFPNDIERRTLWLRLIDREDVTNKWSTCLRVCESHFEPNTLLKTSKRTLLKKGTNPKLLLPGNNNENIESHSTVETCESGTQYEEGQRYSSSQTAAHLSANSPRKRKLKNNILDCKKRLKTTAAPKTDTNRSKEPHDPSRSTLKQCRFCGEFSKECVSVSNRPYLSINRTTLAFNDMIVQVDFNDKTLPKTVCKYCESRLQEMLSFVKVVKYAQKSLINIAIELEETVGGNIEPEPGSFETVVVKTEDHSSDQDCSDEQDDSKDGIVIKETLTDKRKRNTIVKKLKKAKVTKSKSENEDTELIIDIKEEVIEKEETQIKEKVIVKEETRIKEEVIEEEETRIKEEVIEEEGTNDEENIIGCVSDTGTYVKPSESEL